MNIIQQALEQNVVLSLGIAGATVVASTWKILDVLWIKPRDRTISELRIAEGHMKEQIKELRDGLAKANQHLQSRSEIVPPIMNVGQPEAATALTPGNSLDKLFEEWLDPSKTDLQKKEFEKRWTGKKVTWLVCVRSVTLGQHDIELSVETENNTNYDKHRSMAVFNLRRKAELLALTEGDWIKLTGKVHSHWLFWPRLSNCAFERAAPPID